MKELSIYHSFLLEFEGNTNISDSGIKHLSHLTSLSINQKISDEGIKDLIHLIHLQLVENHTIMSYGIKKLTKLEPLSSFYSSIQCDNGYVKKLARDGRQLEKIRILLERLLSLSLHEILSNSSLDYKFYLLLNYYITYSNQLRFYSSY